MGKLLHFADSFRNLITGAGTSRDARTGNAYATRCLTQFEIDAAYRGSGLMRKIIQIPALDMVREWREWKLEADQIKLVEAEESRLGLRQKIRTVEVLRGLGGGALILGLPGNTNEPAPAPAKGSLSFINVVSRWHLSFDKLQLDARLPGYNEPEMWRMTDASGRPIEIHPSRLIPFRADTSSMLAAIVTGSQDEAFWGESTVAQVLEAVSDNDAARSAFASLLQKARTLRVGIPGLGDYLSTIDGKAMVRGRMENLALAESMFNAMIYDAGNADGNGGEKITDAVYSFDGAKEILNAYGEFVAAVSDIPATRLLGRAPEGMNASGESQQEDWRKKVRARQTLELQPCLEPIDAFLVGSALGTIPDGELYEFAPLDTPSQKENAERFAKQMDAIEKLQAMAVIPDQAFAKAVQSLMTEEGYLPGLDQALLEIPEDERFGIEAELPEETPPPPPAVEADPNALADAAPRSLYVSRKLLNAGELLAWAEEQGFETTVPADELHVTVIFSRSPVDWMAVEPSWDGDKGDLLLPPGGARLVEPLGDKGAIVLLFNSSSLAYRHEAMIRAGAKYDFDQYQPHVTITYKGSEIDLSAVEPYRGPLHFGPEIFEEIVEDWAANLAEA
jgi:phage-related protein (TIGR01555 family)